MANPNALPPANDWLVRKIRNLEKQIKAMQGARRLESASIGAGGLTVQAGGSIKFVNADDQLLMTIDGTNGLQATKLGRIGNASLASPVVPAQAYNDVNSTTLTVAGSDICKASFTVPDGCSQALTMVIVDVGNSRASGAGGAPFYAQAWSQVGTDGAWWQSLVTAASCADGASMTIATGANGLFTDLSDGDVINVGAWAAVDSTSGWTTGAANGHVAAIALFLR